MGQTLSSLSGGVQTPQGSLEHDNIVPSFEALAISDDKIYDDVEGVPHRPSLNTYKVPSKDGGFVGGFDQLIFEKFASASDSSGRPSVSPGAHPVSQAQGSASVPLPRRSPIFSMPIPYSEPESISMQHAYQPQPRNDIPFSEPSLPSRPQSVTGVTPPRTSATPPPSGGSSLSSADISKTTHKRAAAASTLPSPPLSPLKGGLVPCNGRTKKGHLCKNTFRCSLPLATVFPEAKVERFCYAHSNELLNIPKFRSHKTDGDVYFTDWIPGYLHPATQVALRKEMEKPRSEHDIAGYVYTFEICDHTTPNKIHLKVGHTTNLANRINQWDKQCRLKENILRGWWPRSIEDDASGGPAACVSLMKGQVEAGDTGPFCHRLERLVHLELADLAVHAPHLKPGFEPDIQKAKKTHADERKKNDAKETKENEANGSVGPSTSLSTSSRKSRSTSAAKRLMDKPCSCGVVHQEIFSLTRVEEGEFKDNEWNLIVKPVIKKWSKFVREYV